jgi:hypothetical protein
VGKSEGKRPLGRPRCRRVDYIKINLREMVCGGMDWIDLAHDRARRRALGSIKRWEALELLHNWRLLKKGSAP